MTTIVAEQINQNTSKPTVMITSGFSSQRVLIDQLKKSPISDSIRVIASHPNSRPEILANADLALVEPERSTLITWLLSECQKQNVKVLIATHNNSLILKNLEKFNEIGVQVFGGAKSADALDLIKDKRKFTELAKEHNYPVADAIFVQTLEEMVIAIEYIESQNKTVCVKPSKGVFASGFWELGRDIPAYYSMMNPSSYKMNTERFIKAYCTMVNEAHSMDNSADPRYLVMPFLSGLELSVDAFCYNGELISKVTRIKNQTHQNIFINGPIDEVVANFVKLFQCHGLINLQARQDENTGEWRILEINARPAGGIGYSEASGVHLVVDCVAKALNIELPENPKVDSQVAVIESLYVLNKEAV